MVVGTITSILIVIINWDLISLVIAHGVNDSRSFSDSHLNLIAKGEAMVSHNSFFRHICRGTQSLASVLLGQLGCILSDFA